MNVYNLDTYLRNDEWAKANKLCINWFFLDMSICFMITAPLSFVKEVVPDILKEEYSKFVKYPTEDEEIPYSRYFDSVPFLEYTEENFGSTNNRDRDYD